MRLSLTEEQALIDTSARTFLAAEYDFARRQRSLQAPYACDPTLWRQFAQLGWLGLTVPEHAGGTGAGMLEAGLMMRAFGRHLVVEPYAAGALLAAPLLARHARAGQCAAWLPALLDGTRRAALAHDASPAPATAHAIRAVRAGNGWLLQGGRQLVSGAAGADLLLVAARVEHGHRIFVLNPGTPGLHLVPARTSDGAWAADLRLDDVRLGPDDLLGEDADATPALDGACARHLAALCWEASGVMTALLEQTRGYVRQRVQFGQPLASFQVVQHRLAEMAVACEEALAACELAALRLDAGAGDVLALSSMAKSKVARASRYVAQDAVQLHGAMGVTEELPVASGFRKLTAFAQQGGSAWAHSRAFGTALLRNEGWVASSPLGR